MALYRKVSSQERSQRLAREQEERIKNELREFALKEIQSAMRLALNDMESALTSSMSTMQADRFIFREGSSLSAATVGGNSGTSWGSFLSSAMLRLVSSRTKTTTSVSTATETNRSTQENQFYRESRSQQEAAITQLSSSGTRNL